MPRIKKKAKDMDDIILDYLSYCHYKDLSKKTIKCYQVTLMLFAKYLKEEKNIENFEDVNKDVVEEYMQFTRDRGKYSYTSSEEITTKAANRKDIGNKISNVTINNYLRNIKPFFTWLEESRVIKNNDVARCKYIKTTRVSKDQLTDIEFNRLIKAIDYSKFHEFRDGVVIQLIMDTAMRITECLSLTINDIDLARRTIVIPAHVTKNHKERAVFYSQKMNRLLQRWLKFKDLMQESELLFPTLRSNGILQASNFEKNFKMYLKRANINKNITPHVLRNNWGRRALLSGMPLVMVSKLLGHSDIKITQACYIDIQNEDLRRSYEKFSPLTNMSDIY
ncbi:tyrosine-type recombinase/integrase [Clostridium beijerinckii]|uniref:Tyrosine recombinase XerC n=1 Tax=Clostridium beijerinckii TaxID=1520 RepID=A0A1S8S9W8_CLOBE|nr:tyrosine-type recombinase/integrase [Clostridium beijerinckii]NRY59879.1 integrase/recombinase XerD [Clostridium beijerinckii]OOM62233.1 tyrosine recombinase XerC [Clostridium beijerinckii]